MNRILRLYMQGDTIVVALRVYIDARAGDSKIAREMIADGIRLIESHSPYQVCGKSTALKVELTMADRFALDCVNVRVYDKTPIVRRMYDPRVNVSRAYFGAKWIGPFKLSRFLMRFPDVFINIAGRDITQPLGYAQTCSVVLHEFGHVLGFADKYRYRGKVCGKRSEDVADDDIMYRTGACQHLMEYHILKLRGCAQKGRLPVIRV
ncbi:MAG: hypothetical protein RR527_00975 [Clostridia bacterium]